ncbi:MAG: sugar ABC transporter ATP-binding protein [Candidatus Acidiferrales bacterium]|jgi:erythritol transport system ATP-binding protein
MLNIESRADRAAPASADVVLEAIDVVQKYGGVTALQGVTYRVLRGKVNVLIGENGAGKSTLMRILAGVEPPLSGSILLDGRPVTFRRSGDAARQGIAMVHQELSVLPNLDIAENIFAGRELCTSYGFIRTSQQRQISGDALRSLGHPMSTEVQVGHLSLGRQQITELARSLAHEARVLILDEPTSALSRAEADALFSAIEDLKRNGVSIVYISHRLNEILRLGDFFTVLRDGRVVGDAPRAEVDPRWIVERVTGRPAQSVAAERTVDSGQEALRVESLNVIGSTRDGATRPLLEEISFAASAGEMLGIYGLLGSGRTELLETLAGVRPIAAGAIRVRDAKLAPGSVVKAVARGIVLMPEDRQTDGLIPSSSIRENISVADFNGLMVGPFISRKKELAKVRKIAEQVKLKADDLELPVTSLSGGNQQKVMLARCLMRSPSILLLDEPTRGVDVGAKQEIHRILRDLKAAGVSIIFTSSEIEETRALADRILVLSGGRISAQLALGDASEEALFAAACSHLETPGAVQ